MNTSYKEGKIERSFAALRADGKKAFIPFITTGDPSIEATKKIAAAMINNGATLIQFGVPYSDPSAEGPVIMRADERALRRGVRVRDVLAVTKSVSGQFPEIPLVLILYYNIIFRVGVDKFFSLCSENGVDGVIVPDLPYEEQDEILDEAKAHNIRVISLVAPTSRERAKKITERAEGFLYCASTLGTGSDKDKFKTDFTDFFAQLNEYSDIPKAIGFGISTPEQAAQLKEYCDGIIVGSAYVRKIEDALSENKNDDEIAQMVGEYTAEMCAALK